MIDNRVCPSVHRPSRDVQVPVPSGPRCSNSLSAASRRSVERPFLVIAANIPHMRSVLQGVGALLEGTTDILRHHHDHSPEYCCGADVLVPGPGSVPLASAANHAPSQQRLRCCHLTVAAATG